MLPTASFGQTWFGLGRQERLITAQDAECMQWKEWTLSYLAAGRALNSPIRESCLGLWAELGK